MKSKLGPIDLALLAFARLHEHTTAFLSWRLLLDYLFLKHGEPAAGAALGLERVVDIPDEADEQLVAPMEVLLSEEVVGHERERVLENEPEDKRVEDALLGLPDGLEDQDKRLASI